MILALTGSNAFTLKQRLNKLIDQFVAEHGDLAVERIDAEEAELRQILDAIQSLPFLAQRKMVVAHGIGSNKQISNQIEQIISSVSDTTDLIFYEPLIDKRTLYYKALKTKAQLEEYEELDAPRLVKWLADEAKKRGGAITLADATYLVERVGANQMLLSNELDKLITYEPKISRQSIDNLVEQAPQTKIFDLLDAAFSGQKQRALKIYDEQRAQKVEPQAIMAMVAWQLQLLALAKLGEGRSSTQIAKDSKTNPYPIIKAAKLVEELAPDRLQAIVSEALEIDIKAKTTAIDLDEALKTYIVTL